MKSKKVSRGEIASWALYDAANSAFPLVIVTAVFAIYFRNVVVGGDIAHGDMLWARSLSISALLVALSSPFLGALADRFAWRKRMLIIYTIIAVLGTFALSRSGPGMVLYAMISFIVANAAFEGGMVFYASLLPSIASPSEAGKISGIGWAAGYLGGLVCLAATIGLAKNGKVPTVIFIVALWYAILSLPLFLFVKERQPPIRSEKPILLVLKTAVRRVWRQSDLRKFFIAYFIYNDAIITTIAFAALFATDELGFELGTVIKLIMGIQLTGAIGAFGSGYISDKISIERTILFALIGWIFVTVTAFITALDLSIWQADPGLRFKVFVATGLILGAVMGATQAASRAFLASVIPADRSGELFGIYAITGRFSAILGPLMFAYIAAITGSKAWSVLTLGGMFLIGTILISTISGDRARAELKQSS